MTRFKNQYVSLFLPSRYERNHIKWLLEIDSKTNTSWLNQNVSTRKYQ